MREGRIDLFRVTAVALLIVALCGGATAAQDRLSNSECCSNKCRGPNGNKTCR